MVAQLTHKTSLLLLGPASAKLSMSHQVARSQLHLAIFHKALPNIRIRLTNVNTGAYTEETFPREDGKFVNMRGGTYQITLYQLNKGNVSGKVTVKTATETHTSNFSIVNQYTLSKTFNVPVGGKISVTPSGLNQSPYNIRVRLTNVNTGNYTEETLPAEDGLFVNMRGGTYRVTLYQLNANQLSGKVTVKVY